jgi:carbon-monoxide dehydrogenase large subunit
VAFDPVALRRRNLVGHFPYRSGLEVTIDCGRFGANLDGGHQRARHRHAGAGGSGPRPRQFARRDDPRLDADTYSDSDVFTFPNGCHTAEVEIDPETGAVTLERYAAIDDYGRLINPMLTMGQVQGGVAQGIGQALLEHTVYDGQSGQLLSGSFADYVLPRADDLPPLRPSCQPQ